MILYLANWLHVLINTAQAYGLVVRLNTNLYLQHY